MTNLNFKQLDKLFRNDDFPKIENDSRGVRFLKLRSMSRKETMEEFCSLHNVDIEGIKSKDYFENVFENENITDTHLNEYINFKYQEERSVRAANQEYLVDQLNRLQNFDWGGSTITLKKFNHLTKLMKKLKVVYFPA